MQVKVWNDNVYPFSQVFKGDKLTIPAGSFLMMDLEEAVEFKSSFSPIVLDADESPLPSSYKMIRIERGSSDPVVPNADLICHANGKRVASKAELDKEIEAHVDMMVDDKEIEKRRPGRPKANESGY
jgi:hypothetical protein